VTPAAPFRLTPEGLVHSGAELSLCGTYRYALTRAWAHGGPDSSVCFIMLNPSTADAGQDDPTIRRCIGFAKSWGYASLEVVNLFAYRATDPSELGGATDPVGPENDRHIRRAVAVARLVVAAWGAEPLAASRSSVVELLVTASSDIHALALTKNGSPKHPLYLRADLKPALYRPARSP